MVYYQYQNAYRLLGLEHSDSFAKCHENSEADVRSSVGPVQKSHLP